tara:strand:- start:3241 stop:3444 length:204 start_codon:yes stop_codon:yes gene_type:complete
MMEDKIDTVGLKEMHPMQVQALLKVVDITMRLAVCSNDDAIIEDVTEHVNDMIQLFGGLGVKVDVMD